MTTTQTPEEIAQAAHEAAGYGGQVSEFVVEIVAAALETERECYEHSARILRKKLDTSPNLYSVMEWANFLLDDLGVTTPEEADTPTELFPGTHAALDALTIRGAAIRGAVAS